MTTLVDLSTSSLRATPSTAMTPAVSSMRFAAKGFLKAVAVSSTTLYGSKLSGGVLFRDGILITNAVSSTTLLGRQIQDGQPISMISRSSTTFIAASTGRSILAALFSGGSNKPYASASGALSPMTARSSSPLPLPYYATATSSLAPVLARAHGLTGGLIEVMLGQLAPIASQSSNRPYASARASFSPLVGLANDPGPPATPHVFDKYMNELMYVMDDWTINGDYNVTINDLTTLTDTAVYDRIVEALMSENVQVGITITANGTFLVIMAETVGLHDVITPDTAYVAWVMNMTNHANSSYTGYQFDSMAKVNGRFLAAGPNGLYELKGDSDGGAPIIANVALGKTDFDSTFKKQIDGVYLGVDTPGELRVELKTDDGRARTYRAHATGSLRTRFVQPGKGMFSRYWQVSKITNPNGDDFTLDSTELVPIATKRRR